MIIVNPVDLRTELVRVMRGVDALVSKLKGNPANIREYIEEDEGDLSSTIRGMKAPSMLVYLSGVSPLRFPGRIKVSFGIAVRAGDVTGLYTAFLSGTSTASGADGRPLLASTIHPRFSPMDIPELERNFIPVLDRVIDYWVIRTAFADRGS